MKNKFRINGTTVEITLTNRKKEVAGIAVIDLIDFDSVKQYNWYLNSHGYVATNSKCAFGKKLHRLILGLSDSAVNVDHFDRNKLNNRRTNVRVVTDAENIYNSSIRKDNKSGYTGIAWIKRANRWQSQIYINGRLKYLGQFRNVSDAILVRQRAEREYITIPLYPK